jgi:soluble lytic murein transglycosylase-like protein
MYPAKGTGIGYDVLKDVFHRQGMQQVRVTDRGTYDGRTPSGSFGSESRHALELCEPIAMGQQSLVRAPSHAAAVSARQHKRPHILHAGIIAAVATALAFAGDATPMAKRQISIVTKDPRTGKLIRTVRVVDVPAATIASPAKTLKPVVIAPATVATAAPGNASIQDIVDEASARHGVDPDLVHSVIKAESNYNPNAVSPVGASGLMQLMPATARQLGVLNAFNPKDNIEGGVKYLRYLQDKFQDPVLALAAYNAGPGSVEKYNKTVPPYRETQDYVVKVAKNYRDAKKSKAAAASVASAPAPVAEASKEPEAPKEPETRKVRAYQDANGRMYLSTQ